jgi:hypothetical protein
MPKLLNLGCGPRFCSDPCRTNVDFSSASDHVVAHDLLKPLPFPAETFDAVHLLPHGLRGSLSALRPGLRRLRPAAPAALEDAGMRRGLRGAGGGL